MPDRPVRALIVSGKGGTGKTTVAAALAIAAARAGRRTLLLELEGRPGAARLLGLSESRHAEHRTRMGFSIATLGPREALVEYLGRFYGMARLAGPLLRTRAVDVATEVAPGFRDLMLAGKLYETAEWRRGSPRGADLPHYDLVVADAPPTGQLLPFLQAASAFAEMIRVGRPGRQARSIDHFLRTRARVVLVTTPEELPVAETLESREAVRAAGMSLGPVVVNRILHPGLAGWPGKAFEELTPAALAGHAAGGGAKVSAAAAEAALAVVRHHRSEEAAQKTQLRRLAGVGLVRLPALLTPAFGRDEVELLSHHVEELLP